MPDTEAATAAPAPAGHNNPPSFSAEIAERNGGLKIRLAALEARAKELPAVITTPIDHDKAVSIVKDFVVLERDVAAAHSTEKAPLTEKVSVIDKFFLSRGLNGEIDPLKRAVALKDGIYLEAEAQRKRDEAVAESVRLEQEAKDREAEAADAETAGQTTIAEVKLDAAIAAQGDAGRAADRAQAPTAELARTYSSQGTASLKYELDVEIDSAKVDLEKLRAFIPIATLQAAAKAWAKMQGLKAETFKTGSPATQPLAGAVFKGTPKSGFR